MLTFGGGKDCAEMEGALDGVLARLVPADPFGLVDVTDALHRPQDVEVLADVQLDAQLVPDPHRFGVGALHQPVGVNEGEVAHEDGDPLAVATRLTDPTVGGVLLRGECVRGGLSATSGGIVHHVIVKQGEGVHQLERSSGVDVDLVVGATAGADIAPVCERRA